jgi:hypothetical protein
LNDIKQCHQARPHTSEKTRSAIIFSEKTIQKPYWRVKTWSVVPLANKNHMHLKFDTETAETATIMLSWTMPI